MLANAGDGAGTLPSPLESRYQNRRTQSPTQSREEREEEEESACKVDENHVVQLNGFLRLMPQLKVKLRYGYRLTFIASLRQAFHAICDKQRICIPVQIYKSLLAKPSYLNFSRHIQLQKGALLCVWKQQPLCRDPTC